VVRRPEPSDAVARLAASEATGQRLEATMKVQWEETCKGLDLAAELARAAAEQAKEAGCELRPLVAALQAELAQVSEAFGAGRQSRLLERGTNPTRSRRASSSRYGVPSCRGKPAGVAKRLRERSPENPNVATRNFYIRCVSSVASAPLREAPSTVALAPYPLGRVVRRGWRRRSRTAAALAPRWTRRRTSRGAFSRCVAATCGGEVRRECVWRARLRTG
jgi:hypothetical protein